MKLNDGRDHLYQWDTGRTLEVDADCSMVHFCNPRVGGFDVEVKEGCARIPDELLQKSGILSVYCFVGTADCGYTRVKEKRGFTVRYRPKPAGYVFSPTEQKTLQTVLDRVDELLREVTVAEIGKRIEEYLKEHPPMADESDPTVPLWAKTAQKPTYTAEEVGALGEDVLDELMAVVHEEIAVGFSERSQLRPEVVNDISECVDSTAIYLLPDGYLYAYLRKSEMVDSFHNYATPLENGWLVEGRIGSDGLNRTDLTGVNAHVTNFIPVTQGDVVRIKGGNAFSHNVCGYSDDVLAASSVVVVQKISTDTNNEYFADISLSNDVVQMTIVSPNIKYMRYTITAVPDVNDIAISVNEEIGEPIEVSTYRFANTGHAFVPADCEDRILQVEEDVIDHIDRIDKLEKSVEQLDRSGIGATLPDYWREEADLAVERVKQLQTQYGKDAISFAWFSDLHFGATSHRCKYFGKTVAYVMDQLKLPFAVSCGDSMTGLSYNDLDEMTDGYAMMHAQLAPIEGERLLLARGNHDDVYSNSAGDAYANKVSQNRFWHHFFRNQANDHRRVFGADGSYFYVDQPTQKLRLICLDSDFYAGDGIVDEGSGSAMCFGFGATQLQWLQNVALQDGLGEDWSVAIFLHIPPTYETIHTVMHGDRNYGGAIVDCDDFQMAITHSGRSGQIAAIFCGHCHLDTDVFGETGHRVITVTTAGGTPYDGTGAERITGTATEFAFDVVTLCRSGDKVRTVHTTRVGWGEDRSIPVE